MRAEPLSRRRHSITRIAELLLKEPGIRPEDGRDVKSGLAAMIRSQIFGQQARRSGNRRLRRRRRRVLLTSREPHSFGLDKRIAETANYIRVSNSFNVDYKRLAVANSAALTVQ
jgi:hypothetical protein